MDIHNRDRTTPIVLSVQPTIKPNKITDEGAKAIANSPHLANLTRLDLFKNNISPAGVKAILASAHLNNLFHLDLVSNDIDIDAAMALEKGNTLPKLKVLIMY